MYVLYNKDHKFLSCIMQVSLWKIREQDSLSHSLATDNRFTADSVHGFKYFLTILDDYSRHVWTVMLKSKSEVSDKIKSFINMVEIQFEKSCVATPQQNGRVEMRYQHILNIRRALMFHSSYLKCTGHIQCYMQYF